jgi:protein involved in polysaccharide export with SLBB domain
MREIHRQSMVKALLALSVLCGGCYSITNGWLDPTALGRFNRTATLDIRDSLTLEDSPMGLPGETYPAPEDREIVYQEYPISGGDGLAIEVNELRDRGLPFQGNVSVTNSGYVNLPIVGRVRAAGLTVPEFEDELKNALRDRQVLLEPEVTVNPQFLQKGTYSIFGIGVSASDNSPLRAGIFPIRRPDLRVLEAINQVGGLNEFVTDVYIFRYGVAVPAPPGPSVDDGAAGRGPSGGADDVKAPPPVAGIMDAKAPRPDTPAKDAQQRELLDVVERPGVDEEQNEAVARHALEPETTFPFLWINNEWVPNPAFRRPGREAGADVESVEKPAPSPLVNWSRVAGDSTLRIIRVPAEALRSGDPEANIYVRAGDVLRIVSGEIGVYYVMGQVNRPGPFRFDAEAVTLKSAIAVAGGLAGLAWPSRCTVYRRLGQGEQMIQVNLDRIFAGVDPDFLIKRGDIINVGTHPFAPFLQRIRAWTLPNPVNNVGYSFTYARNFADIDSYGVRANPANQPDRFPNFFP